MMSVLARAFLILAYVLCSTLDTSAQVNDRLQRVLVQDGLSQADVRCMLEDADGFLWIGTRDGLNRYDGSKFWNYLPNKDDASSISFNQINALALDQQNNLWIGTTDGISMYHSESDSFSNYPFDQAQDNLTEVNHIFRVGDDFMLSTTNGLITFDIKKKSFGRSSLYPSFQGEVITEFHLSQVQGTWIATTKGVHYKKASESEWTVLLEGYHIEDLYFEGETVFISTRRGLFRFNGSTTALVEISLPANHKTVFYTLRSSAGELWVAANKVVIFEKDDTTVRKILSHDPDNLITLSEDRADVLYETKDGTIWIGTNGYGLNKYRPAVRFFSYLGSRSDLKLSSNYISGIHTIDDRTLLIATSRGLNRVSIPEKQVDVLLNDGGINPVFKIAGDANGSVWISCARGFYRYRDNTLTMINFPGWVVSDIDQFDDRTLLLTTQVKGVFLYDKVENNVTQLISAADLPRATHATYIDGEHLWIGSDDGLRIYTRGGVLKRHFRTGAIPADGFPSDVIKTIFKDNLHQMWLGTWGGGLCMLDLNDSTFISYDKDDGLPNNVIYGILEDANGNLWMSTNAGISVFDRKKETFYNFDYLDGLQGNEFNTNAFFKSKNGKMYFGGTGGLTFFDPEKAILESHQKSVKVINVAMNDRRLSLNGSLDQTTIETDWKNNNVSVEFTAVDFQRSEKLQFQYSVNDEVWFNLGSRRNLELADLSAGKHKVKLRARSEGGDWSAASATLMIDVEAPPWKNPFIIGLFVLILGFATYLGHKARIRFLEGINKQLNNTVAMRTRELQIKTEEILAQNEELTSSSEQLAENNLLLERQGRELLQFSSVLEQKVQERTRHIQQLNDELKDQNVQLEQFSFIAAHNFRGPLARIQGIVSLMKASDTDMTELRSLISYLETSTKELDQVIRDMSKILNLKKGSSALFEPVQLKAILTSTLQLLSADLRMHNIRVETSEFQDISIQGVAPYVQSVFYNLLENGARYADKEKADSFIKVTCRRDGQNVVVQFIDNGVGFDMKLASDKIFRLYQRLHTGSSGRGLGLYLVRTQMELMGGTVAVHSSTGEGSVFTLIFQGEQPLKQTSPGTAN
jgi:ligand-binding sensor domain-containing protein/signal transduction histidine kinase